MSSIRTYLLWRLLGGTALILLAAGAAVFLVVKRSLLAQFDGNLADRVQGFASILFQVEDDVSFEFSDQLMPEYERAELPDYFELRFADGRLLERSNSLAGRDLSIRGTPGQEPQYWSAPLPDGRPGRYVAQLVEVHHVYPEEGPDRPQAAMVLVALARGREPLVAAERAVLLQCSGGAFALILLIAGLSWTSVKRGLAPANRLASELDAIDVDHLPEGLNAGELPSELAPVAEKIDALILRVESALERERRTSADIAHELRTPLSELLTVSEVSLRNGRDHEAAHRALRTVRDVAWRMGRSVSTLLKLARLQSGAESFAWEAVDLGTIVSDHLRSLSAIERERELRVENRVGVGDLVDGDADVLRIVVSNLLSNALSYAPPRTVVDCRLDRSSSGWLLCVANDAGGLRVEELKSLSEPFWRKDSARSDRDRSGLGLALSRALAERSGMELRFELERGVFRATLCRFES